MTLPEAWCRTYTLLVPAEDAGRRRAEVASHVHEARVAGASRWRSCLQALLGAVADLTWSDRVRRRRGLAPLLAVPLLDAGAGAIVAGLLVLFAFGLSSLPGRDPDSLNRAVGLLAVAIALSGHVAALVRRRRH